MAGTDRGAAAPGCFTGTRSPISSTQGRTSFRYSLTDPEMQEALGLKVSQFPGLVGDDPESAEDRALSTQASTSHMQCVLAKLRNSGREKTLDLKEKEGLV